MRPKSTANDILRHSQGDSHFLEQVSVSDDLELFQYEVDTGLDEELLVRLQRLRQHQQVPLSHSISHTAELHHVILGKHLCGGQPSLQQYEVTDAVRQY